MSKRLVSIVSTLGLIAGLLVIPVAGARAQAVTVPAEVQIADPKGDANFVNDQDNAYGTPLAGQGDHAGPADVGSATDILRVWFTNTPSDIALNVELEGNPTLLAYDTYYRFNSNAGKGAVANDETRGCLQWIASINGVGGAYTGATEGTLVDKCNVGGTPLVGPLTVTESADKTFVLSITFSRSYSPLLADGQLLTAPFGVSRIVYAAGPGYPTTAAVVTVDNTKRGSDYAIVAGGEVAEPEPQPTVAPPGKNDPPGNGKKKGCDNGKGVKKGACPGKKPGKPQPPAPSSCAPYQPGEMGKDAQTTVVTDAATEDKPIEIPVPLGPATGNYGSDRTTRMKHNVQVDSAASDAGLWVRLESPPMDDPDLYVYWPQGGKPAAVVGGFNPLLVGGPLPNPANNATVASLNGQGQGGHSEFTAEQVDGLRTSDCQGWTLDLVNWAGRGGCKLKLGLGEAKNDPAPPAAESMTSGLYDFLMSF